MFINAICIFVLYDFSIIRTLKSKLWLENSHLGKTIPCNILNSTEFATDSKGLLEVC